MLHWLIVYAGLSSPSSPWYLFWSGIGADWTRVFSSLAILGGVTKVIQQRAKHHSEIKEMHERHHREMLERD